MIHQGKAALSSAFKGWDQLPFPDTLQGVISSRVDRLPADAQGVLKVASVIGRHFIRSTLEGVQTDGGAESPDLTPSLALMENVDLIIHDLESAIEAYAFRHIAIQQVTYGLLLFQQRQHLHRRVAGWYEASFASNLEPYAPVLGYHWREANVPGKSGRLFCPGRQGSTS